MVEDIDWGKRLVRPVEHSLAILPAEPSSCKLGGSGQGKWILPTKYFFHTCLFLLDTVKSCDVVPRALPLL
jgi:hypothetical protein